MFMTVKKFILIIVLILLGVLYSLFFNYHSEQKEKTASVILQSIKNDLSETAYILSKNINTKKDVKILRAYIDRLVSNQGLISTILIIDDDKVLVTTDPHFHTNVATDVLDDSYTSVYKMLIQKNSFEDELRFYEGNKVKRLRLVFLLDKDEVLSHFDKNRTKSLLYFGLAPISLLIIVWFLLRIFISKPLEKLRQFAYYNNKVPKAFKLRELESIRYSMVESFSRLESEKQELYTMARTDALSGLANRNSLKEYLQRLINDSNRKKEEFAFLFLDLDNFKTVNDSLGHNVGDELLKSIALIIKEVIRSNDFVARVGGDEFVVVLHEYNSVMELTNIIQRIQKSLSKPWLIQTNPITISSSVGIAIYPKDGNDMVSLMKHADIAMYEAKKDGKARYHFFTKELNKSVQDIIALDKAMRKALEDNEYELYFQPKVDISSGNIVSCEALVRWISPTKGMIAPDVFIPLAEENGFIIELGEWIYKQAMKQSAMWKAKGIELKISINISSKQLLHADFSTQFLEALKAANVETSAVDIEITEYIFLNQNENNLEIVNQLHDSGITISLDDFGTGYSSLSYLKKFPIDYIKIDKSFLDDYNTKDGSVFVQTIVKMGQTLNIKIVAEGVEKEAQVTYLKSLGCDEYQGYVYSKPLCVREFEDLYLKNR